MFVGEGADLEFDENVALQNPMIKDEIDKVIGVSYEKPLLACLEAESVPNSKRKF